MRAKLRYATKNYLGKIAQYREQEAVLGERNSCSKTDTDATFMRMKDDHMNNGQLKPGYNVQIFTSSQFIVNFIVRSNPADTGTLPVHLAQHGYSYDSYPDRLTADAGYGSEENYTFLEEKETAAYIKYASFNKQQIGINRDNNPFSVDKLFYNREQDCYIYPMGQQMECIGVFKQKTSTEFEQQLRKYQAKNCDGCP